MLMEDSPTREIVVEELLVGKLNFQREQTEEASILKFYRKKAVLVFSRNQTLVESDDGWATDITRMASHSILGTRRAERGRSAKS